LKDKYKLQLIWIDNKGHKILTINDDLASSHSGELAFTYLVIKEMSQECM